LTLLATSREPIGVAGEVSWRVPSLSLADEALELFTDRARRTRPDFTLSDDNAATVGEICRRLDGLPLAIELAAARVRALSLTEILDSLHDRFWLLTGGARTAVRRQQTLRASVDWSHALLTEPERVLFRRLAAFMGGFDLDAAQAIAGSGEVERYQVLDQLGLLVDKSLVVADDRGGRTRYRLLETVRQYALEKLGESGEADAVRTRHRDYFTEMAAPLDSPAGSDYERHIEQAETEIDNLRAAFSWSRENCDVELALALASSLHPLWQARGRLREGRAWFDAVLTCEVAQDSGVAAAIRARALADKAGIDLMFGAADSVDRAQQALALAREIDDPAVLARALTACGLTAAYNAELAGEYFAEAAELARESDDRWRLSQILAWQANSAIAAGDPIAARLAADEGRDLAEAIGDGFNSRHCRITLGVAQMWQGDPAGAVAQFRALAGEAGAAHDGLIEAISLAHLGTTLAFQGDTTAARTVIDASLRSASEFGGIAISIGYFALGNAALAAGDVRTALDAGAAAWEHGKFAPGLAGHLRPVIAQATLASGDLIAARRWADDAVGLAKGWAVLMRALSTRARLAIAQGELEQGERDAHESLASIREDFYLAVPDTLECVAALAGDAGSHREAARLFGAAAATRQRMGAVRFKVWEADYEWSVAALRDAMGQEDFDAAWAEGAALSTEEAIAYAKRGRGQRKRPATGWASLTPTELDVVRLVSEGLGNNDIAARLFVSPRTVQTHLTHVYTKLGLSSRVQLVQETARHN
jgi:predicted ATPase/DNA-binding CsgD family transcriptional regulator